MTKEFNLLRIRILLCSLFTILLLSPAALTAQRTDNFFGYDDIYNNRYDDAFDNNVLLIGGLTGENPTVPLDNGLLVLVVAAAGYVIARRKSSLRKCVTLLLAVALILGMTQCKKNRVIPDGGKEVFITLNATYGGDRTTFIPGASGNGSFVWKDGVTEYVEVGLKKVRNDYRKHIGYISGVGDGTNQIMFSGSLYLESEMDVGDSLYFFYLGTSSGPRDGNGDHLTTLNISSQSGTIDDVTQYHWAIGGARCNEANQKTYSAKLETVMSILYVDLSGFGNETIRMYGDNVYSVATIDYGRGKIKGTMRGGINIGKNGTKYIALIPSTASATTVKFASSTKEASMNFFNGIKAGKFYSNAGSPLRVEGQTADEPEGALTGLFTVGSGKQVKFSKGNLQYDKQEDEWSFLYPQYTTVEVLNQNVGTDYASQRYVSLFGWGTSGFHDNNDIVNQRNYPYTTANNSASKPWDYAPDCNGYGPTNAGTNPNNLAHNYTMSDLDFIGTSIDYDWGLHNAIENGGNAPGKWRTLTKDEWVYLFDTRTPSANINGVDKARYTETAIEFGGSTVYGIILFPDNYTGGTPAGVTWGIINAKSAWSTTCTSAGWEALEEAGCVFLPASGYRNNVNASYVNSFGYYWSSTHAGTMTNAHHLRFLSNEVSPKYSSNGSVRSMGCSVRLVRDAN